MGRNFTDWTPNGMSYFELIFFCYCEKPIDFADFLKMDFID